MRESSLIFELVQSHEVITASKAMILAYREIVTRLCYTPLVFIS
ncbi:hypothetical protein ALT785_160292 [Alteromonas infernus]